MSILLKIRKIRIVRYFSIHAQTIYPLTLNILAFPLVVNPPKMSTKSLRLRCLEAYLFLKNWCRNAECVHLHCKLVVISACGTFRRSVNFEKRTEYEKPTDVK